MKKTIIITLLFTQCILAYTQQSSTLVFTESFESTSHNDALDTNNPGSLVTNTHSFEGTRALELKSNGKVTWDVKLKPNSRYKLTAYLKTAVGAEEIQMNILGLKYNNASTASALTSWTLKELTFQTDVKQDHATIELYHPESSALNSAWADKIELQFVGEAVFEAQSGLKKAAARNIKVDLGIKQQSDEKLKWFQDAKFGLFIHWGIYAGPAMGEWYMRNKAIPINQYRQYAYAASGDNYFAADNFNPKTWASLAREAGMKYMNLTTQHHDGYALFHSKYPDSFNSYQTHNRDFVKEYVDACREAGLYVGLYKTLINWRFPGYYNITGNAIKKNAWGYTSDSTHKENARTLKEELYCKTKELLQNYGKIDQLFWDGGWIAESGSDADGAPFWESGKYLDPQNQWPIDTKYTLKDPKNGKPLGVMGMVRELQPDILVNPRCGWYGDYMCEEGGAKISGPIRSSEIYEKTLSLHFAWGYTPTAEDQKKIINASRVKRYLVDCLMRNMCLLINVGPDRHGNIPEAEANVLRETGKWIKTVEEAVYGTRGGPWNPLDEQYGYAYKNNKIYVYILPDYVGNNFQLPSIDKHKVKNVYCVNNNKTLKFKQKSTGETSILNIDRTVDDVATIIAIELNKNVFSE